MLLVSRNSKMGIMANQLVVHVLRLGSLCLFVAASAFAQQDISASPDTIFYNGKIITVDSRFTIE